MYASDGVYKPPDERTEDRFFLLVRGKGKYLIIFKCSKKSENMLVHDVNQIVESFFYIIIFFKVDTYIKVINTITEMSGTENLGGEG